MLQMASADSRHIRMSQNHGPAKRKTSNITRRRVLASVPRTASCNIAQTFADISPSRLYRSFLQHISCLARMCFVCVSYFFNLNDFLDLVISGSPNGRCYGNQLILWAFRRRRNWPPSFFALAFRNELRYRQVNYALIAAMMLLHSVKIWW